MRPGNKSLSVLLASLLLVSNASVALGNGNGGANNSNGDEGTPIEKIRAELMKQKVPASFKDAEKFKKQVEYKDDDQVRVVVELDGKTPVEYATEQNQMYKDLSEDKKSSLLAEVNGKKDSVKNAISSNGINVNYQNDFSVSFIGFSGVVKYKDIQKLEGVKGVKNVYLANEYDRPTPEMTKSHQFIQSMQTWADGGFKGEGMVVSVIDSGVDPSHRDFVVTDKSKADLTKDKVNNLVSSKGLKGKFYTDKVPYGYNYYDKSDEILDKGPDASEHGMHVAGTVAANGDTKNGGIKGVAPEAQVLGMKVFSNDPNYPSTFSDIYLKAIDDSIALGANVLNMSLGSTASFYFENSPEDKALKNAVANGVVAAVSAGNSGYNGYNWDKPFYENQDIGLVGAPGLNKDTIQVAASGNAISEFTTAVTTSTGQQFPGYGVDDWENAKDLEVVSLAALNGKQDKDGQNCTVCGGPDDYKNVDVKGKVVLVKRGSLAFADKTKYAKAAGAKGIIVYDAGLAQFYHDQGGWGLPFMLIGASDGSKLDAAIRANGGKVTFSTKMESKKDSPEYGKLTDFSSWGTTPSLELKPEITAPGGGIWSTLQNNEYGSMSGTSMASPHVAGGAALVQQALKEKLPNLGVEERTRLVKNLLMSTSDIIIDKEGNVTSPRKQGSGMMQLYAAVSTPVYITQKGTNESKVELKDFTSKQFSFELTAHNMSDENLTYNVDTNVLADKFFEENGRLYNGLTSADLTNSGAVVNAPKKITVPAGQKVDFKVSVDLSKAKLQGKGADGKAKKIDLKEDMFVEGFVKLTDAAGVEPDLSIPYLGFYGKWDRLNIVDGLKVLGEDRFFDVADIFDGGQEAVDDQGKFLTPIDYQGKKVYAFSPNEDGYADGFNSIPALLRNAGEIQFNVLDKDSNPLRRVALENFVRKNYFNASNKIYPYSYKDDRTWNGKVKDEAVADGLYYYEIKSKSPVANSEWQSKKIPVLVDNTAPVVNAKYDKAGSKVTWTVKEEGSGLDMVGIFVNGKLLGVVDAKETSYNLPDFGDKKTLIEVAAFDNAMNIGVGHAALGDVADPIIFVDPNTPGVFSVYKEGKVPVKGYITDDMGIDVFTINGKEVQTKLNPKNNRFEFDTVVEFDQEGQKEIIFKVVDLSGKVYQVSRQVLVDMTPGSISHDAPATVPYETEKVNVKVKIKDNFNFLDFYVDGSHEYHHDGDNEDIYGVPVEKEVTIPLKLALGENKFTFKLVDIAGHETLQEVKITRSKTATPPPVVEKGWVLKDGKWFFYNDKGVMQTGWVKDGGKWYFLASNGVMQTGWVKDAGKWYYLASHGAMQTGWVKDAGKWYFLASHGAMQTGWVFDGGKWYYLASHGAMQTGWVKDGGKWYYLASNGAMQTGWLKEGNKWYYLSANGSMVTGWVTIGGKKYYFNASGVWVK